MTGRQAASRPSAAGGHLAARGESLPAALRPSPETRHSGRSAASRIAPQTRELGDPRDEAVPRLAIFCKYSPEQIKLA
jgi:hypothetical protein